MPLVDGIETYSAEHAPDLRREKRIVLADQDLKEFCRKFNLPMFRMENVMFRDGLVEKKTDLNMLFTRFRGIWIMAYEDKKGGEKDGRENSRTAE